MRPRLRCRISVAGLVASSQAGLRPSHFLRHYGVSVGNGCPDLGLRDSRCSGVGPIRCRRRVRRPVARGSLDTRDCNSIAGGGSHDDDDGFITSTRHGHSGSGGGPEAGQDPTRPSPTRSRGHLSISVRDSDHDSGPGFFSVTRSARRSRTDGGGKGLASHTSPLVTGYARIATGVMASHGTRRGIFAAAHMGVHRSGATATPSAAIHVGTAMSAALTASSAGLITSRVANGLADTSATTGRSAPSTPFG